MAQLRIILNQLIDNARRYTDAGTLTIRACCEADRVKIAMSGKFLPYKYYGATGNNLAYGLKEE